MAVTLSGITEESTHLSGNPIKIIATTDDIPAGATDYKLLLKVVSADGELPGGPFIDEKAPDENDQRSFDISGYVDQEIQKAITWPLVGFGNGHPQMVYDLWLYPGERYIDTAGALQESYGPVVQPIFIVKGKLQEYMLSELVEAETTWSEEYCEAKKFFTAMPRTQIVSPWQPVKLWWKTNEITEAVTGIITGFFSDGSTQVIEQNFTAYRGILLELDLQPEHNGFVLNDNGLKLVKYTFTIGGETFTFNIDWTPFEKYYYLFADNQMGGIDCIWLSGRKKYSPTGERTIASKPRESTAGVQVPTLHVSGNKRQRRWIINTGFKPGEMPALDILLDSTQCWLALPPASGATALSGYSLVPCIVTNTGFDLEDDRADGMDNIDLEIIEAH